MPFAAHGFFDSAHWCYSIRVAPNLLFQFLWYVLIIHRSAPCCRMILLSRPPKRNTGTMPALVPLRLQTSVKFVLGRISGNSPTPTQARATRAEGQLSFGIRGELNRRRGSLLPIATKRAGGSSWLEKRIPPSVGRSIGSSIHRIASSSNFHHHVGRTLLEQRPCRRRRRRIVGAPPAGAAGPPSARLSSPSRPRRSPAAARLRPRPASGTPRQFGGRVSAACACASASGPRPSLRRPAAALPAASSLLFVGQHCRQWRRRE